MTEKKKPKFLRRKWRAYSKLGLRRKKKRVWRKPTGRDNKMREKRRGYPAVVSIGYGSDKRKRFVIVSNIKELEKAKGKEIIIGNIGKKKKLELAIKARELKIKISNINPEKYLEKNIPKDPKKTSDSAAKDDERKKEKVEEKKDLKKEEASKNSEEKK